MKYCLEISSSVVSLGDYLFSKASAILHLRIWGIQLFCREKLEDPSGEEVQEKSALYPCSKEGQPRAGQQECRQQVRASDYRHVFNTCKTTFHSSFLAFHFKKDIDLLRSPSQWGAWALGVQGGTVRAESIQPWEEQVMETLLLPVTPS